MTYLIYLWIGLAAFVGITLFTIYTWEAGRETGGKGDDTDHTSTEPYAGDSYTTIEAGSQDNEKCYLACLAQSKRAAHRYFEALRVYHSYSWWDFGLRRYWKRSALECKADARERSHRAEEFRQAMLMDQAALGYYKGREPSPPPLSGEHRRT